MESTAVVVVGLGGCAIDEVVETVLTFELATEVGVAGTEEEEEATGVATEEEDALEGALTTCLPAVVSIVMIPT